MEQSPLCYAALKYMHSLIGVREKKRWKKCEKIGRGTQIHPFVGNDLNLLSVCLSALIRDSRARLNKNSGRTVWR